MRRQSSCFWTAWLWFCIIGCLGIVWQFADAIRSVEPVPAGFRTDPAFWYMLTPAGQEVLADVTVILAKECEIMPGHPYIGGVYQGDVNTIRLCGEAAQADPMILRHEALHALDAAGAPCSMKMAPSELVSAAEALYNAGGGGWFRPGELYAMLPLVVDWHFDQLPPAIAACYEPWFTQGD